MKNLQWHLLNTLTPCGVGIGNNITEAYHKAFETDTVSPFGGIFAVNRIVDKEFAETVHGIFSEIIVAPDYTEEALEILTKKRDRRLIKVEFDIIKDNLAFEYKSVVGGVLMQETDKLLLSDEGYKVVTQSDNLQNQKCKDCSLLGKFVNMSNLMQLFMLLMTEH